MIQNLHFWVHEWIHLDAKTPWTPSKIYLICENGHIVRVYHTLSAKSFKRHQTIGNNADTVWDTSMQLLWYVV